MAQIARDSRSARAGTRIQVSPAVELVERGGRHGKAVLALLMLLAGFIVFQGFLPLGIAVQIGADEGFELAKATLLMHGHGLYTEAWNDQPPLHTFLVVQVLKHGSPGVLWLIVSLLGWNLSLGKVLAAEAAIVNNFLWNDRWTFRAPRSDAPCRSAGLKRFLKFNLI